MPISISQEEILETIRMVEAENLDIRTITMGISLRDCSHPDIKVMSQKIYDKITSKAENLVQVGEDLEAKYGIPILMLCRNFNSNFLPFFFKFFF